MKGTKERMSELENGTIKITQLEKKNRKNRLKKN